MCLWYLPIRVLTQTFLRTFEACFDFYTVNNMERKISYRREIDGSSHLDQRFISQRMFHYIYEINLYTRGASHKGKRSILITIRGHSPLSMRYYHIIYEKYLYIRDASHKHNKSLLISIIGPLSTLHEMILFINKRWSVNLSSFWDENPFETLYIA